MHPSSYSFPQERYQPLSSDYHYMPENTTVSVSYAAPYDYPSTAPTLPLYYNYSEPEYCWGAVQGAVQYQPHHEPPTAESRLYAPIPVSGYTTLLVDGSDNNTGPSGPLSRAPPLSALAPDNTPPEDTKPLLATPEENPLDVYLDAPQVLFPTPSELLNDLNAREHAGNSREDDSAPEQTSSSTSPPTSLGKRKREAREKPENLNQRKAYFRAVSDNVGFTITDPDTITSHDKKRSYLECLEEYVQWLHDFVRHVGHEPIPLERISNYRGLKHRSLRTMLVHMQNKTQKLNIQKQQAERKFMELQNAVLMRQATEDPLQFRRHSVAMGAIPHGVVASFVP